MGGTAPSAAALSQYRLMPARVIADSSIWIDHINEGREELASLLKRRRVVLHPMIIGEIALGSIAKRRVVIEELSKLPSAKPVAHAEVMALIEWHKLFGSGVGYVDAHLLASALHLDSVELWTRDKSLLAQAQRLGVAYEGNATR